MRRLPIALAPMPRASRLAVFFATLARFNCNQPMPRYSNIAILLHWLMALLIVAAFLLGVTMVNIQGITPAKLRYVAWHKWVGVSVLGLAGMRLLWRLKHAAPPYPESMPNWQRQAAHGMHALLYLLLFAVPLSGYFFSLALGVPVVYLGIIALPVLIEPNPGIEGSLRLLHFWLNLSLFGGICLHILAVSRHHLIAGDGLMRRMLPSFKSGAGGRSR